MIKVGCCGYPVSMKRYYESFHLVELNTTFYRYPRMSTVERWRKKAPANFEFSVKAHRDISHNHRLKLKRPCLDAFEQMKEICCTLKARILLVQTPASFKPERLDDAKGFFSKVDREDVELVWETRGPTWETLATTKKLEKTLKDLHVAQVTDPLKILPAYTSDVVYFRLHGLGKRLYYYQYSDEEMRKLEGVAKRFEAEGKEVYVLFNNLSMFEDGVRFQHYLKTGKFRSITGATGVDSAKNVVERTRYPTSKAQLMKKTGWRLVELEGGKAVRLRELLKRLPSSKTYESADQVLQDMKLKE